MTEQDKELYERMLSLYEKGEYSLIKRAWRTFPGELRIELIYRAARDGVKIFTDKAHFELFKEDMQLIKDARASLIEKFGLDISQSRELTFGLKGARYETQDEWQNLIARTIAVYSKLREYEVLVNKYDCLTYEFIRKNFSILKCDPRRTESRIKFLIEQGNGKILDESNLASDLSAQTSKFNLKYQREIEQKLYLLERGTVAYTAIAEQVTLLPDFAYDKFLELGLRAIYGDEVLLRLIDKKRRAVAEKLSKNNNKPETEIHDEDLQKGPKDESPAEETVLPGYEDDVQELEDLFNGVAVIPVDEGGRNVGNGTGGVIIKPNNREFLDEAKIEAFLAELRRAGIECEGTVTTKSGVPALDKEEVILYVLKVGNYRVLEPIGQVGNATYLTREFESIEELREVLGTNTRTDLVRNGFAIRLNHDRTEEQSYEYSTQRIKNIVTLVEEFKGKKTQNLTLSQVREQVTQMIAQEEVPEVSKYIWELSKTVGEKIAKFVLGIRKEENDGMSEKQVDYSEVNEGVPDEAKDSKESKRASAEEVGF